MGVCCCIQMSIGDLSIMNLITETAGQCVLLFVQPDGPLLCVCVCACVPVPVPVCACTCMCMCVYACVSMLVSIIYCLEEVEVENLKANARDVILELYLLQSCTL